MQQVFTHRVLLKKNDLDKSESEVDKLDIDKLQNVPSNLSNVKSEKDKFAVDKLVLTD